MYFLIHADYMPIIIGLNIFPELELQYYEKIKLIYFDNDETNMYALNYCKEFKM